MSMATSSASQAKYASFSDYVAELEEWETAVTATLTCYADNFQQSMSLLHDKGRALHFRANSFGPFDYQLFHYFLSYLDEQRNNHQNYDKEDLIYIVLQWKGGYLNGTENGNKENGRVEMAGEALKKGGQEGLKEGVGEGAEMRIDGNALKAETQAKEGTKMGMPEVEGNSSNTETRSAKPREGNKRKLADEHVDVPSSSSSIRPAKESAVASKAAPSPTKRARFSENYDGDTGLSRLGGHDESANTELISDSVLQVAKSSTVPTKVKVAKKKAKAACPTCKKIKCKCTPAAHTGSLRTTPLPPDMTQRPYTVGLDGTQQQRNKITSDSFFSLLVDILTVVQKTQIETSLLQQKLIQLKTLMETSTQSTGVQEIAPSREFEPHMKGRGPSGSQRRQPESNAEYLIQAPKPNNYSGVSLGTLNPRIFPPDKMHDSPKNRETNMELSKYAQ